MQRGIYMRNTDQIIARLFIFTIGLLVMSLGIVLIILSDFGASPWDVFHVGLFYQLGLTIGTWSIVVGLFILGVSAIITREWPKFGAYLNMIMVGVFIDMYMLLPFLYRAGRLVGKNSYVFCGHGHLCIWNGYLSLSSVGAGPRDSLMLAMTDITGWKVANVRRIMEVTVLIIGWMLGGPVFIGTLIFSLAVGTFIGLALPHCRLLTNKWLRKLNNSKSNNDIEKEASL